MRDTCTAPHLTHVSFRLCAWPVRLVIWPTSDAPCMHPQVRLKQHVFRAWHKAAMELHRVTLHNRYAQRGGWHCDDMTPYGLLDEKTRKTFYGTMIGFNRI